ncbi:SPASM domain-containing protein (plasmid) [Kovacikia minuta CCNUW1]|uniref:radical SAM/SPASM domain-containing protein n=1 Tax=Kovacikia minuta TaxID=2931930 RepID=UPI001CCCA0CB|nr:SPASM domain-containing protein [Kovacikia minuta]UBF29830.1 SPASM domain-containing protein [Kovacikia minuta CCNUW1]
MNLPSQLWIETTTHCNAQCPLCPTGLGTLQRPKQHLDLGLFKRVVNEVRPKKIMFWNFGEPFLHPQIIHMFSYAASFGCEGWVSSNGYALYNEASFEALAQSGLKYLIISLDGLDQETLSKYRVGVDFNRAFSGLKAFMKLRPDRHGLRVIWQFVTMQHNYHQLDLARRTAQTLGCLFWSKRVNLAMVQDHVPIQDSLDWVPDDSIFSRYDAEGDIKEGLKPCHFVNHSLVLLSDGRIAPCCHDPQGHLILGDANQESISQIWSGDKMKRLREKLTTDRKAIHPCGNCPVGTKMFL